MNSTATTPLLLLITLLAFLSAGCNPDSTSPSSRPGESGSPQTGLPTTTMTLGHQTFTLEIASTDHSREVGLMYRDAMPADHGMIFVFTEDRPLSFWMKHTRLPLDVVYVNGAGKIVSIHQMQPFDLSPTTAAAPAKYAIELNQGAAAAAGLHPGDPLQLPPAVTSLTPEPSR